MQQITTEILAQIKSIVGAEYVFTDEESFEKYGRDETEKLQSGGRSQTKNTTRDCCIDAISK
jgi:translation elongation factor P/translation initiation factor 5A